MARWRLGLAWLRGRDPRHERYRAPPGSPPDSFISRYELLELLDLGEHSPDDVDDNEPF